MAAEECGFLYAGWSAVRSLPGDAVARQQAGAHGVRCGRHNVSVTYRATAPSVVPDNAEEIRRAAAYCPVALGIP